jgi:hypothetical protein
MGKDVEGTEKFKNTYNVSVAWSCIEETTG